MKWKNSILKSAGWEVLVDEKVIRNVSDYKITSSADGTTELVLKLLFRGRNKSFYQRVKGLFESRRKF